MIESLHHRLLNQSIGLYTDHYQLTMAQGYFLNDRHELPANFDYFFRVAPFSAGYVVFSGLSSLLASLADFRYSRDDLGFLRKNGFHPTFLDYLEDFELAARIYAPKEGELVFPNEPIVRVEGRLLECQLVETLLLNFLNFESLIATKAARVRYAAGPKKRVIDFGLRRAQGLGGLQASKASLAGGCDSTSNVLAAKAFDLAATGTMAHSWIQSYADELTAFRDFVRVFPNQSILLVDTYDTLHSGMPHAIQVALEMEARGERLRGIRLDSGDLERLSKACRKMLDDNGLHDVKIVASNQLDEFAIERLERQQAPIDAYGVGTRLVTGSGDGALDGVYKLTEVDGRPQLKISESQSKTILPAVKELYRFYDENDWMVCDGVVLKDEEIPPLLLQPFTGEQMPLKYARKRRMHQLVMEKGVIKTPLNRPQDIAAKAQKELRSLPARFRQLTPTDKYFVGISPGLMKMRNSIVEAHQHKKRILNNELT